MEKVDNGLIKDKLEELLFNKKRVVTALTLARYADTKSKQAMSVMNEFYSRSDKEFLKKKGLYGVYLMSGVRKDRDELHRNASILVREANRETTKETFSRIDECTLFSLQCIELEDLCHIFRADEEDNLSFLGSDHERFGIVFTDLQPGKTNEEYAAIARKKMPNSFDVMKKEYMGLEHMLMERQKQHKKMKASPSKARASTSSTGKKSKKDEEASNSRILSGKRLRKIMLDNESEGEGEAVVSPKEREVKKGRGAGKTEKRKKRATIESDDGLFDASGESPVKKDIKEEEMDEDEMNANVHPGPSSSQFKIRFAGTSREMLKVEISEEEQTRLSQPVRPQVITSASAAAASIPGPPLSSRALSSNTSYECKECGSLWREKTKFSKHQSVHAIPPGATAVTCLLCDAPYRYKRAMMDHMKDCKGRTAREDRQAKWDMEIRRFAKNTEEPEIGRGSLLSLIAPSPNAMSLDAAVFELRDELSKCDNDKLKELSLHPQEAIVECGSCGSVLREFNALTHFFDERHIRKVRAKHGAVSKAAVDYWKELMARAISS